jgi:hypothetical protein
MDTFDVLIFLTFDVLINKKDHFDVLKFLASRSSEIRRSRKITYFISLSQGMIFPVMLDFNSFVLYAKLFPNESSNKFPH